MAEVRQYSSLFTCLYDEPEPIGSLGRGTHYSVFRSVEWLDVERRALPLPQVHDFAVIWDEDHDERVIDAIERIYMAGLLSPVQFIGERKAGLTAITAARFYFRGTEADTRSYGHALNAIAQSLDDPWNAEVGSFDRSTMGQHQCRYEGLIHDREHRVDVYLRNIDSLWGLGTRPYLPPAPASSHPPFPPMPGMHSQPRPFPPVLLPASK